MDYYRFECVAIDQSCEEGNDRTFKNEIDEMVSPNDEQLFDGTTVKEVMNYNGIINVTPYYGVYLQ
jgi:hypothetical protein